MKESLTTAITRHKDALKLLEEKGPVVETIANLFIETLKTGGKIIFIGNGGSAADAQHLAAELVGRFRKNRKALAAIALTTDTSILTAVGNDFGFDEIFSRQIKALAKNNDLLVGISTSGKSKNIIKALKVSKAIGLKSIGFLGQDGGEIKKIVDVDLTISLDNTPAIQEMHILAGHAICGIVEDYFNNNE